MLLVKKFFEITLYQPLYNILMFLVWLVPGHSVGWAIVILTVLVRLALLPSGLKQARMQQKMKQLQRELQEIKRKYQHDRQAEAQATMALYRKHGVSPFSGCLPMLIQLPILIILYRVFMVGFNKNSFNLLYPFVPRPEFIQTHFFGIDLSQPDRWVLPILAGVVQFIQSWQVQKLQPQPEQTSKKSEPDFSQILSRQMMFIFPVMTVIIGMRLPAALPLYWIVMTLFMIAQQWWVSKQMETEKSPAEAEVVLPPKKIVKETKKTRSGVTVEIREKH